MFLYISLYFFYTFNVFIYYILSLSFLWNFFFSPRILKIIIYIFLKYKTNFNFILIVNNKKHNNINKYKIISYNYILII